MAEKDTASLCDHRLSESLEVERGVRRTYIHPVMKQYAASGMTESSGSTSVMRNSVRGDEEDTGVGRAPSTSFLVDSEDMKRWTETRGSHPRLAEILSCLTSQKGYCTSTFVSVSFHLERLSIRLLSPTISGLCLYFLSSFRTHMQTDNMSFQSVLIPWSLSVQQEGTPSFVDASHPLRA
jgi:hypothetical protein